MRSGIARRFATDHLVSMVTATVIVLVNASFITRYSPITEGWWHVYVDFLNQGRIPYRDFELLVPVGYPAILRVITALVGPEFLTLRIIGVVVQILISLAILSLLRPVVSGVALIASAVAGSVLLTGGTAFISYDYVYFAILFLLLVATFLQSAYGALQSGHRRAARAWSAAAGAALFGVLMIKQTQAAAAIAMVFALAIISFIGQRGRWSISFRAWADLWWPLSLVFLVLLGLVVMWLWSADALSPMLQDLFSGAAQVKGGDQGFLFRWANEFTLGVWAGQAQTLLPMFAVMVLSALIPWIGGRGNLAATVGIAVGVAVGIAFAGTIFGWMNSLWFVAPLGVALVALVADQFRPAGQPWTFVAVASVALAWAGGMSAGLTEIGVFLGFSLSIAFASRLGRFGGLSLLVPVALSTSVVATIVEQKSTTAYAWWGYSLNTAEWSDPVITWGLAKGLHVNSEEYEWRRAAQDALARAAACGTEVVAFPSIPLLALDAGSLPRGRLGSYWLDFSSQGEIRAELTRLRAEQPLAVALLNYPVEVYEGHERLFNSGYDLEHRRLAQFLKLDREQMPEKAAFPLGNGIELLLGSDCQVTAGREEFNDAS